MEGITPTGLLLKGADRCDSADTLAAADTMAGEMASPTGLPGGVAIPPGSRPWSTSLPSAARDARSAPIGS